MIVRILAGLLLAASVAVAQQGIPSTVKLRVSDDMGSPVTNVAVAGCFLDFSQSGARSRFNGFTDTNGIFVAKGETVLGVYARFTRDGFYPTTLKEMIEHTRKADGKGDEVLDRWDCDVSVLLKRIRHPIGGYQNSVENPYVDLWQAPGKYRLSQTSSYDILQGTFLPPYGKGHVGDLEFKWKMTIFTTNKLGRALEYDTVCEVCMTNVVDGIYKGTPDGAENGELGSAYFSAYEAPADGYTNAILFSRRVRGMKAESNDDQHYLYYFRIRTQTNETGQVTNALYGKIYGRINGNFTCYLNPTPNDRNVEFDSRRALQNKPVASGSRLPTVGW